MFDYIDTLNIPTILYRIHNNKLDINIKIDKEDNTFLHYAIFTNNYDFTKKLLELNANHTLKNKFNQTPFDLLASSGMKDIISSVITAKQRIINELLDQKSEYENEKKKFQKEIENNYTHVILNKNEISSIKNENAKLVREVALNKTAYSTILIKKRESDQKYLTENHKLKEDNKKLSDDYFGLRNEFISLGKRKRELETECNDLTMQNINIEKKLKSTQEENVKAKSTIRSLMEGIKK